MPGFSMRSPRIPTARSCAINIGGIPDTLLESELFGYEKGAFTGAADRKRGMLELASAGTLFLDEIGDMPMHLQVKLLRVLQEKKVQRLGGTQPIPINARIVAATNRDLEALLKEGKFREDLYYRLNVIRIEVPPLRERREDIPRWRATSGKAQPAAGTQGARACPGSAGPALGIQFPGKHSRAGERDRAGLHPLLVRHDWSRVTWASRSPGLFAHRRTGQAA